MITFGFIETSRTLVAYEHNEARLLTPQEGTDLVIALSTMEGKTPAEMARVLQGAAAANRSAEFHSKEFVRIAAARDKLQAFKDFVHKRLDEMGIPTHPDGPHSKDGCRVGDRLDIAQQRMQPQSALAMVEQLNRELQAVRDARNELEEKLPDGFCDEGHAPVRFWTQHDDGPARGCPVCAAYKETREVWISHFMAALEKAARENRPLFSPKG